MFRCLSSVSNISTVIDGLRLLPHYNWFTIKMQTNLAQRFPFGLRSVFRIDFMEWFAENYKNEILSFRIFIDNNNVKWCCGGRDEK